MLEITFFFLVFDFLNCWLVPAEYSVIENKVWLVAFNYI